MKKIFTAITAIICAAGLATGLYFVVSQKKAKYDGEITIEVIDFEKPKITKTINFVKDDTLVKLVQDNFNNVKISDGMIYSIETIETPSDWSTFICIKVNQKDSLVGINDIPLINNDLISFVNTVFVF